MPDTPVPAPAPTPAAVTMPKDFIKLSDQRRNVFVRRQNIAAVLMQAGSSQVITEGGAVIRVDQSPDDIFKAMAADATPPADAQPKK